MALYLQQSRIGGDVLRPGTRPMAYIGEIPDRLEFSTSLTMVLLATNTQPASGAWVRNGAKALACFS